MKVFEAESTGELTAEEYKALVQTELDAAQKEKSESPSRAPNTVSITTKP